MNTRFESLDAARGLSAILVCAGHLRSTIFVDYAQVSDPNLFDKGFYFATGLGHQAVMVFFVLSGFFVGGAALRSGKHFCATSYSVSRLSRLWTVLIPALFLTLVADIITASFKPEILTGARYLDWSSGPQQSSYSTELTTFFANIFFIQTIAAPTFGSNGPLWSLANEFWYYVMFPFFAVGLGMIGRYRTSFRVLAVSAGAAIALTLPIGILAGFQVWLMGVFSYLVAQKIQSKSRPLILAIISLTFIACLVYTKRTDWQNFLKIDSDFLVGLSFSFLCVVIASWSNQTDAKKKEILFYQQAARISSEISYSLYLTHFPLLILLSATIFPWPQLTPSPAGYLTYLAALSTLIISGSFFWICFERKTPTIRAAMLSIFRPQPDVKAQKSLPPRKK